MEYKQGIPSGFRLGYGSILESYVEKVVTSTLPGADNMSPKLTRRVKMGNQSIVLTGILPKSEIASKPIWQSGSGKTTLLLVLV